MNTKAFEKYLATGEYVPTMDSGWDLEAHDRKYHPGGYKEGDRCKVREAMAKSDDIDEIADAGDDEENDRLQREFASVLPKDFVPQESYKALKFGREPTREQLEKAWENFQKMNERSLSRSMKSKEEWFDEWRKNPHEMSANTGCPFLTTPENDRQEKKFKAAEAEDKAGLRKMIETADAPSFSSPNINLYYDDYGGTRGSISTLMGAYHPEEEIKKVVQGISDFFKDRLWWVKIEHDNIEFGVEGPDFTPEVNSYYKRT